jgi:hypothetical protein
MKTPVLNDGKGYGARLGGRESDAPIRPSRAHYAMQKSDGKPYREREANLIHSLTGRGATIF